MFDRRFSGPAGFLFYKMRGASSNDILNNPQHSGCRQDMSSSANNPDCTPWACLGFSEETPHLEPHSSGGNAISDAFALLPSSHDELPGSSDDLQIFAGDQPCHASCTITLSPALGSPANFYPPTLQTTAPDAPTLPLHPPSWAEPQPMSGAQHAGELCIPPQTMATPGQLAAAAESPNTPLQQALLPRVPAGPEAAKPRRGFSQRNRVRTSVFKKTTCICAILD